MHSEAMFNDHAGGQFNVHERLNRTDVGEKCGVTQSCEATFNDHACGQFNMHGTFEYN